MTGKFRLLSVSVIAICLACAFRFAIGEEKKAAEPKVSADQAKAAFAAKFADYKAAIADVEKLQAEFQTADAAKREKAQRDHGGPDHPCAIARQRHGRSR